MFNFSSDILEEISTSGQFYRKSEKKKIDQYRCKNIITKASDLNLASLNILANIIIEVEQSVMSYCYLQASIISIENSYTVNNQFKYFHTNDILYK